MNNTEALMQSLVCPQTRAPLVRSGQRLVSTDEESRLAYPIRDDVPIMLADEAETLSHEEWRQIVDAQGGPADA